MPAFRILEIPRITGDDLIDCAAFVWPEHRVVGSLSRHGSHARLAPESLRVTQVDHDRQRIHATYAWLITACCADDCHAGTGTVELRCTRTDDHLLIHIPEMDERSTAEEF